MHPKPREIFVLDKESERRVAALRGAEDDKVCREKIRGDDALRFRNSISYSPIIDNMREAVARACILLPSSLDHAVQKTGGHQDAAILPEGHYP
jgi:hypothetical protein